MSSLPRFRQPFQDARGPDHRVDAGDSAPLAKETINLIENHRERTAMSKKAYDLDRLMSWSNVSAEYLETFADVVKPVPALK